MANSHKFKANSAILKLMFSFMLAFFISAPSCSPVRRGVSRNADDVARNADDVARNADDVARKADDVARNADDVARKADDVARNADDVARNVTKNANDIARFKIIYGDDIAKLIAVTNPDDITKLNHNVLRIKINNSNNNFINYPDNISILTNKAVFIKNPSNFARVTNGDVIITSSDRIALINNVDEIRLKKESLKDLLNDDVILTFPHSITLKDLDNARRNALQQASEQAAQGAVRQALADNVSSESLEILAKEAAERATIQELRKQTKPWIKSGTIVIVSTEELDAIVNQSIDRALQECERDEQKTQKCTR